MCQTVMKQQVHMHEEVQLLKRVVDGLHSQTGISSFSVKPWYSDAVSTVLLCAVQSNLFFDCITG